MPVSIKRCYLFVLDNVKGTFIPTNHQLNEQVDGAIHFIEKNIEKCMKNAASRPALFTDHSELKAMFLDYKSSTIPFLEFANAVAYKRYDFKDRYEIFTTSNLFMCEIVNQEIEYVVGLELINKNELTNSIEPHDLGGVQNNLALNQDVVASVSLSNSSFFMIDTDKMKLTILEKLTSTSDDDTFLYADKILECETDKSIKEVAGLIRRTVEEIATESKLDKLQVIPTLNKATAEAINAGINIDVESIINEALFPNTEAIQNCIEEIEGHGVKRIVPNENRVKWTMEKNMKLKTDTGIEIIVPVDYYYNKDFIEITETAEGRKVIYIKNLGNIENK